MKRYVSRRTRILTAVFLLLLSIVTIIYQYSQLDIDYYLSYQVGSNKAAPVSTAVYHSETGQLIEEVETESPWTTQWVVLPGNAIYVSVEGVFEQGDVAFQLRMARNNGGSEESICENSAYVNSEECYLIVPDGTLE
ncbi:MAG: hypothetical protein AAF614_27540 [Chloroflexota bacterium]